MPSKPKKPCNHPACPELTIDRYCDKHGKQATIQQDRERGSAAQRGYDSRWRKASKGFIRKHPLCKECERQGRIAAATVVDHIRPHKGDKLLFWDRGNWQPLCKKHHDQKTAREDGGFGR